MKRDLSLLDRQEFDLVVVGGGIFGACAAWDASLRGLSVALIERSDFGAATSANSLKMIHGGIRYLQHLDFYRIRQSSAERRAFLRIAPHLVQPLPIVIPTYGHLQKGKLFLRSGMTVYDLLTLDRNRGISDPTRRVPSASGLSRNDVLELFPRIPAAGLTGGVVFSDVQMYNPPRLVLAVVRSAVGAGTTAANYVEIEDFLTRGHRVVGVQARDRLSGEALEIRGKYVLNAAGPFAERLLERSFGRPMMQAGTYSRDACFVVKRLFDSEYALAIAGQTRDPDAKLGRGARHLFLAPWRQYTLIGVWHVVCRDHPDALVVTEDELSAFIAEVNGAYPELGIGIDDVEMVNTGLVPFGENPEGAADLRYGHRSHLIDHAKHDGLDGLVTLIGVRYTTGRWEAERAVDLVAGRLGRTPPASRSGSVPLFGGDIEDFGELVREAIGNRAQGTETNTIVSLVHNHGTNYREVLEHAHKQPDLLKTIGESSTICAEIAHSVRKEMAIKLTDIVFRRTDLGTGELPSPESVALCANLMATELGWDSSRVAEEIEEVLSYPSHWSPTRR